MFNTQFWFGLMHFKYKTILIFSRKIASLVHNFTLEKALFKLVFWLEIFICEPNFKNFATQFKTSQLQMGDTIIVFLRCSEK